MLLVISSFLYCAPPLAYFRLWSLLTLSAGSSSSATQFRASSRLVLCSLLVPPHILSPRDLILDDDFSSHLYGHM